jgi:Flp pilus assembly protein TadB
MGEPQKRLRGMLWHVPSIIGFSAFAAICYVISAITLTGMQLFLAVTVLIIVYSATTIWYIWMNL